MNEPPAPPLPGTDPLTTDLRGVVLPPSPAVTVLCEIGSPLELELAPTKASFVLGSLPLPHVDVSLPRQYVSRTHAALVRDGNQLIVTNQSSNGTMFNGRQESRFMLRAGDVFRVGQVDLLALDDHLRALRPRLLRLLGFTAYGAVDSALIKIADPTEPPLLLAGPAGSELEALARTIHIGSGRRDGPFLVIEEVSSGKRVAAQLAANPGGTVFVDLAALKGRKATRELATALFGPDRKARIIVGADSRRVARTTFESAGDALRPIEVPTVASRAGEVSRLINLLLAELGSARRLEELPRARFEAVCAFGWPKNHADLRSSAPVLRVFLERRGNMRAAARDLDVSDTALRKRLRRIGAVGGDEDGLR